MVASPARDTRAANVLLPDGVLRAVYTVIAIRAETGKAPVIAGPHVQVAGRADVVLRALTPTLVIILCIAY
jgi:hypothetical protein